MLFYIICNGAPINRYGFVAMMAKKLVAIHVTKYFATIRKPLNDSLRFRWEFVDLDDLLTKFQRFFLWQNVVAKHFATNHKFVKMLVYFRFLGCGKTFCHNILPQKKTVRIS